MAGPKQEAAEKKSSAKPSTTQRKTAKSVSVLKRAAQDVYVGPSSKQIERSLNEGKKHTLEFFRNFIDWS